MGCVRTETVKKVTQVIIEKYYTRLSNDFHTNKHMCKESDLGLTTSFQSQLETRLPARTPAPPVDPAPGRALDHSLTSGCVHAGVVAEGWRLAR